MRYRQQLLLSLFAALFIALAVWLPSTGGHAQGVPQSVPPLNETSARLQDEQNTIDIVEMVGPSVVAVNVEVRGERINPLTDVLPYLPPQLRDRLPDLSQPNIIQGSGSGFVIADGGQIISNYHVIQNALVPNTIELRPGASIKVVFPGSDEELDVVVVGANPDYDVALLQLADPSQLPDGVQPVELADSSGARVGQKVIAIGNPFGLQSSVTQGIVSAIGRELPSIGRIQIEMIQTDAAINPGNSGGPLLDSSGRLLGVNTMIVPGRSSPGQATNIGIGFAVPSALVAEALPMMQAGGLVGIYADAANITSRPRLGLTGIAASDIPANARSLLGMPDEGVVVMAVEPDSPAEEAGLIAATYEANIANQAYPAGGDIIVRAGGQRLRQVTDLQRIVLGLGEGDTLELEVWRGGETRTVTATLRVVVPPSDE
ncbi:MAG: trypsin-like peptidase domain-containing protein [Trueperaceae bacterium]|nr:trypsin-like peptidase domain-containing protein [Trueperaceae bacterium]